MNAMNNPIFVNLGTPGFSAETSYSGTDYRKWVSRDGNLVVGSLPEDDMPDISQVMTHSVDGVLWTPITLGDFARLQ